MFSKGILNIVALMMLASASFVACNHLFYYPHGEIYLTPARIQCDYSEISMNAGSELLKGWHIHAQGKPKHVAVLQFHGNAENRSTHFLSIAWLAKQGVDVVVFDYRGYNGSTGKPTRHGLVEDGVAALGWLETQFPSYKRFVIGQSLGGAVAVPSLARFKGHIDGLVLESTFASYRGIARKKLAGVWLTWPFQWLPWILLSGDQNPIDHVAQLKMPVMAFHDQGDPVVPIESGMDLYKAFASNQISIHVDDGVGHAGAFAETRVANRDLLLKFIGAAP